MTLPANPARDTTSSGKKSEIEELGWFVHFQISFHQNSGRLPSFRPISRSALLRPAPNSGLYSWSLASRARNWSWNKHIGSLEKSCSLVVSSLLRYIYLNDKRMHVFPMQLPWIVLKKVVYAAIQLHAAAYIHKHRALYTPKCASNLLSLNIRPINTYLSSRMLAMYIWKSVRNGKLIYLLI